jgi:hypothetical protein
MAQYAGGNAAGLGAHGNDGRPADARTVTREGAEQRGWHSRMQMRRHYEAERGSERCSEGERRNEG